MENQLKKLKELRTDRSGMSLIAASISYMENILYKRRNEKRRLRQEIGEEFISWANMHFAYEPGKKCQANTNYASPRKDLFNKFIESSYEKITPFEFKNKFKKWCKYSDVNFHWFRYEGIEYYSVSNPE